MRRVGLVLISSLVVAACGAGGSSGDGSTTSTTSTPSSTSTTVPTSTTNPDAADADLLIVAAVDDLLGRVDAARDDIEVVSFESGTWNDGSLGCPEEGLSYTQALVEGHRIKLMVNGTVYVYAQGGDEPVFYCEQPNEDGFKTEFILPDPSIPPPID